MYRVAPVLERSRMTPGRARAVSFFYGDYRAVVAGDEVVVFYGAAKAG